jgi:GNAT superfamily N-acetyltransferase
MLIRTATIDDFDAIHRVRLSVLENRLADPTSIGVDDYLDYITRRGRGWVAEVGSQLVGFAIGDAVDGSIWALFVDPRHAQHGIGRALHDVMVTWLFDSGLPCLQLGTEPGTRAEQFYRRAGWQPVGHAANGELRFELRRRQWAGQG